MSVSGLAVISYGDIFASYLWSVERKNSTLCRNYNCGNTPDHSMSDIIGSIFFKVISDLQSVVNKHVLFTIAKGIYTFRVRKVVTITQYTPMDFWINKHTFHLLLLLGKFSSTKICNCSKQRI